MYHFKQYILLKVNNKMCFILTAIKIKEDKNCKDIILDVMRGAQNHNANGTGAVAYKLNKSGKPVIKRDMAMTKAEMENDLKMFDVVSYHFRMATIGTISKKNVHFWKKGDWTFAHNGQIYDIGYNEKSDSLVFFEQLIKNDYIGKNGAIKYEKIKEFTNTFNFWGRFILINTRTKNIYFFGNFQFYLLNRAYMVITSATADFEGKVWVNGIDFDVENSIEVLEKNIEGIYMLNPRKGTFKQVSDDFITRTGRTYYHKHTPTNQIVINNSYNQSMGFESVGSINSRREESGNLNSNEKAIEPKKEKPPKLREEMSYIREFYGRLNSYYKKHPEIQEAIWDEGQQGLYNDMGLTETEQYFWKKWIEPQLPENNNLDFVFANMNLVG